MPGLTMRLLRSSALPLAAIACASVVHAQTPSVTLHCGGVGIDESAPMRAAQSAHALTILFATRSGSYVAGVSTRVEDPLADVSARQEACGPVALVDVTTAGRYRVVGRLGEEVREEWVDLKPAGGSRIVLRWPD